ncbi:MAG: CrcB family protein [Flavobacteriales bacterium]|nr:CrcB family protein [Flavobacteriales bacterium]
MNTWLAVLWRWPWRHGALRRFAGVGRWFVGAAFPWATLVSNDACYGDRGLVGVALRAARRGKELWWTLLAVGFCGGFSTFSAFSMETLQLMRRSHLPRLVEHIGCRSACLLVIHLLTRTT